MMRTCDGSDRNLLRKIDGDVPTKATMNNAYVPCNCGLSFDDLDRSVVFPHQTFYVDTEKMRLIREFVTDLAARRRVPQ